MKNLLLPANRVTLHEFVRGPVALVFDFDGTLAPIVRDPAAAALRPRTRALLARVAKRYPTAVLSGRAQKDVAARLHGIPLEHVVGNHGFEWTGTPFGGRLIAERVQAWHAALRTRLGSTDGVEIEDKRYSLAIHYRRARDRAAAEAAIAVALRGLRGLVVTSGRAVVNVLAAGAPDKGRALQLLQRQLGCARAIVVGDDSNDEAAFALDEAGRVLAVRVGARQRSHARFFLRSQAEIDPFLQLLARVRQGVRSARPT
jgi:trehalose 6-phosphate phosphatase